MAKVWQSLFFFMRHIFVFFVLLSCSPREGWGAPNFRQGQLIIDAEATWIMRQYLTPIFLAAGLSIDTPQVFIVVDDDMNAFATPGGVVFVHTGLLYNADSALELLGVLAHETGHIARHHIVRRMEAFQAAQNKGLALSGVGLLLGLLGGRPDAAAAGWAWGSDVAQRSAMTFTRGQEASADQVALGYLDKNQWSCAGMSRFFEKLQRQELLPASKQSKFLRTHPLTQERLQYIYDHLAASPYKNNGLPKEFDAYYDRLKAKLYAYTAPIAEVKRRYPPQASQQLPARYAQAIISYREGRIQAAKTQMEGLINDYPNDPFFWEFLGQLEFEAGRHDKALAAYTKASTLLPAEPLFYLTLAQIYMAKAGPNFDKTTVRAYLDKAISIEPSPLAWYFVAVLEGQGGEEALAALALAEKALLEESYKEAIGQAKRAIKGLAGQDKALRRAQDILMVAQEKERASK